MKRLASVIALLFAVAAGCAPVVPPAMSVSRALFSEISSGGGEKYFPEEYRDMAETLASGDRFLKQEKDGEAQQLFELALLKGELLRAKLAKRRNGPITRRSGRRMRRRGRKSGSRRNSD